MSTQLPRLLMLPPLSSSQITFWRFPLQTDRRNGFIVPLESKGSSISSGLTVKIFWISVKFSRSTASYSLLLASPMSKQLTNSNEHTPKQTLMQGFGVLGLGFGVWGLGFG